ncbi:unnamed protein product [Symbiodinium sp. CCMP2456]|nr:unnamed protein product [Symbiodinium sp. CCMP2456]
MAASEVERTKEGVPKWDGSANTFTAYEEACYLYEAGTEMHKHALCGPRLISELSGAAKRMVSGRTPTWVSNYDGVRVLLEFLRQCLGKPQIPEMTEHLSKYFKHCRRKAQESMNEYITRKAEAYLRAEQALQRVIASQKKKPGTHKVNTPTEETGGRQDAWSWYPSRRSSVDSSNEPTAEPDEPDDDQGDVASTQDTWRDWQSQATSWSWSCGHYDSYYHGGMWGGWSYPYGGHNWWQPRPEAAVTKAELLPSFVQGWYLLQDANLSQTERNMVQTALGGCYDVDRVVQELRNQWSDHEVKHRDQGRHTGYLGEAMGESDGHEEEDAGEAWMSKAELDEEGHAALQAAEQEAQEAMAAISAGKRTLREARFRQHQVKLGRQYYRNGPRSQSSSSGTTSTRGGGGHSHNSDANMTCLKCGKVGHRAANCKDGPNKALQVDEPQDEQAPFVCFGEHGAVGYASLEETASAYLGTEAMTTSEAVREGHAIIDGGATRTLASVHALECLMRQNEALHGDARIHNVDVENTPTFGFGNSSSDRCVSTVNVGLKADGKDGEITIHPLNKGEGPILLSVATLRNLGAVLDFSNDLVVFRRLNKKKIIKVGRSATGHQTLSLKDDLYANAEEATQEIPSLRDFLPKTMDRMTKEEMLRLLTEIGEHVPDNWTRAEVQHRMEGCYKARSIDVKTAFKKQKTPLRTKIAQLNTASRKKADLVKLLQEKFMMDVNPLQTIKQLQGKALDYIYEHTACSPDDQVSFGRHAQMTYVEKECCIHLRRFAMWLEQEDGTDSRRDGARAAPSASSAASEVSIKTEVLQDLAHSVAALREEVANMKEERPRKKESRSEFSLVSTPAEQDKCRQLSVGCASRLEDAAWSLVPKTFHDLVNQGRPVLMEIGCELSYQAVKMECAGQTGLPEAFGRGEFCVCGDLAWPGIPRTLFSDGDRNQIEELAKQLRTQDKYSYNDCEGFLEAFPSSAMKGKREMVIGKATEYRTFGAFSHGGQYGTTVVCHQFPETVKYLNAFLRSKTREHDHWSSFTINRNQKLPIHRDVHNHAQELSMICGYGMAHSHGLATESRLLPTRVEV